MYMAWDDAINAYSSETILSIAVSRFLVQENLSCANVSLAGLAAGWIKGYVMIMKS